MSLELSQVLLTIPAITATVQWLKTLGISGRASQLSAVIVGVLFALVTLITTYSEQISNIPLSLWLQTSAQGFMHGLASAGFYDLANGNFKQTPRTTTGKHALNTGE
ncbi:hypothetical protein RQN30_02265 [Arcanobacterium hippocoleae]